ncbi:unnamed protein product [Heterobilharzia americana]|nr:unnamed protein product [Heterobilharzia americana]
MNASLGGYVRVINSLDWSPIHPFLLATTSADQFRAICVWDIRDLSRPVRAMESLSSPVIVKWNRFLGGKFATCHSSGIRIWDLRTIVPEQYLTVQGEHVNDFDWSPQNVNHLVAISDDPQLCIWDIENASCPVKKIRLHEIKMKKVLYTPSGDHIVILPEQSYWSTHGITVWTSSNLTQSHDLFQKNDNNNNNHNSSGSNSSDNNGNKESSTVTAANNMNNVTISSSSATALIATDDQSTSHNHNTTSTNNHLRDQQVYQTHCTDSYVLDMNWLIFSPNILLPIDDYELATANFQLDNEIQTVNQSVDYCPRKLTHLLTWSMDQVLSAYPIHSKTISCHDTEPLVTNQSSKQTRITKEKSTDLLDMLSSNTSLKTNQSKKASCVTSVNCFNKLKTIDGQIRGEESGQRSSTSKSSLSISGSGVSTDTKSSNQEDSAFQFLAQELSLLSPRAGQYKLEEVDLINRTAKLILFYCRRDHYHHYSLCSITNNFRRRRHSAEMNNEGLDSLLLPSTTDLISQMEFSKHSNFWTAQHRNSSSSDIDPTTSNDIGVGSSEENNTPLINNDLLNRSFTVASSSQYTRNSNNNYGNSTSNMPLAGSIILSVEFPASYPLNDALPEFHILDCNPSLPAEVLDELKNVLHSTASELVCTSRGCVEPCIRNAVITLQTYRLSYGQTKQISSASKLVDSSNTSQGVDDDASKCVTLQGDKSNQTTIGATISTKERIKHSIGIPFPRTSGVHFTTNGSVVLFGISHSLSSIRSSLKTTTPTNSTLNNNTKDWTPQSYNAYQLFVNQFSSVDEEYNADMRKSFQNCIGSIIDSFTKLEASCGRKKQEDNEQNQRKGISEMIDDKGELSPLKINLASSRNSFDLIENNKTGKKNSSESIREIEQKWTDSMSTCINFVDAKHSNKTFASQFNTIYPSNVQICDMSPLIWDRNLMYEYSLNTDNLQRMCTHNLNAVLHTHRKDLIRFWQYALVLSVSFGQLNNFYQTDKPLASQLIGRPLFDTWIQHFLRVHDVQSLAMAVLVIQSLNRINELQLDVIPSSRSSLNKLDNTLNAHSSVNSNLETLSKYRDNEFEKKMNHSRHNMLSNPTLELSLPFTSGNAGEMQSWVQRQSNKNMSPNLTEKPNTNQLSINSICAYYSRFVHLKDLFSFDHYISVYASIIYSLHEYILHARLLRSWSSSIRINSLANIWPYVQTSALILLSCPDIRCTSNFIPKQFNGILKSVQCTQCQWEVNIEHHKSSNDIIPKIQRLLICSICRNTSRGLVLICPRCNHGGHVNHIYTWFNSINVNNFRKQCPFINCDCFCSTVEMNSTQIVQIQ